MLNINEAGQKWFFENIAVPYLKSKIVENWDDYKHAWFSDIEECVRNTFTGDAIIYEIEEQFTIDKQTLTFKMHNNFIDKYFD
jgi:hypothetical protein